jgi:hypothetical protein
LLYLDWQKKPLENSELPSEPGTPLKEPNIPRCAWVEEGELLLARQFHNHRCSVQYSSHQWAYLTSYRLPASSQCLNGAPGESLFSAQTWELVSHWTWLWLLKK